MNRSIPLAIALLFSAALALILSAPAWADSSSRATVSNMRFELIDLDPNDDIAPSITFNSAGNYNSSAGSSVYEFSWGSPVSSDENLHAGTSRFGAVASTSHSTLGFANASVSGDGTLGGTVLQASGSSVSAADSETDYFAGAGVLRDRSNAYSAQSFSLSANTRVVFSADVSVFAQLSDGVGAPASAGGHASAYAQLLTFDQGIGPNVGSQLDVDEVTVSFWSGSGPGATVARTASVTFDNATSSPLDGAVGISANVNGQSFHTSVVPEPASAASLALGLAMMFVRLRPARPARR
ncbi:hypothetical protein BH11PSE9_BH11PSE9_08970 [soil metagenome]